MTSLRFAGMACSDMVSIRIFGRCIMDVGWSVPDGWIRVHGIFRKWNVRWSTARVRRALLCRQYVTTSRLLTEKKKELVNSAQVLGFRVEIRSRAAMQARMNLDRYQATVRRKQKNRRLLDQKNRDRGYLASWFQAGAKAEDLDIRVFQVAPDVDVPLPLLPSAHLQSPASPSPPNGR